jgi:hypothetical protein
MERATWLRTEPFPSLPPGTAGSLPRADTQIATAIAAIHTVLGIIMPGSLFMGSFPLDWHTPHTQGFAAFAQPALITHKYRRARLQTQATEDSADASKRHTPAAKPDNLRFAAPNHLLSVLPNFPAGGLRDRHFGYQAVGNPSEMRFPTAAGEELDYQT